MEPSPFFRQHVRLEAPVVDSASFRTHWRIVTRLDELAMAGEISRPVYQAARTFQTWALRAAAASYGAPAYDRTDHSPLGDSLAASRRIDAKKRLERVRAELGHVAFLLLECHVVHDQNWADIGERFCRHPNTVKRWTITALHGLAGVIWTMLR